MIVYCPCGNWEEVDSIGLHPVGGHYYYYCDECRKEVGKEDNPEDTDEDLIPKR